MLGAILVLLGCKHDSTEPAAPPAIPVDAVKAVTRDVPNYQYYPGTTQSPAVVDVDARVEGYLDARLFREGQDIEKDDPLFLIQPDKFEAEVLQAEAFVLIATAGLEYAQLEYRRNKPLAESGAISQQEWDKYARLLEDAIGQFMAAEANLAEARLNLSYCNVKAPISGRIGRAFVDVGNLVGPTSPSGSKLATIVQLDLMRVLFSPAAREFALFEHAHQQGTVPVRVTIEQFEGESVMYDGVLDLIDNVAQQDTSTFLARAIFPSLDRLVLPDQYAAVRVKLGMFDNAVLVPSAAVIDEHTKHYVYVVKSNDTVERRAVQCGQEYGALTRISSGLEAGEIVIVGSSPALRTDGKVSVTMKSIESFEK
jgi:membrane fusion protein (multidrug efflux system)